MGQGESDGVAAGVKATEGGITYVEWSYANDNDLGIAKIDNGGGAVELNGETAGLAVAAAKPAGKGNDLKLKLDYATKDRARTRSSWSPTRSPAPRVWRPTRLLCSSPSWPSPADGRGPDEIGYAPIPEDVRTKVADAIDAMQLTRPRLSGSGRRT